MRKSQKLDAATYRDIYYWLISRFNVRTRAMQQGAASRFIVGTATKAYRAVAESTLLYEMRASNPEKRNIEKRIDA